MIDRTLSNENSALKVKSHIFHQTCESMCTPLETGDLPPVVVNPEASFEPVRDVILDLREKVEDLCNQELSKITKQGLSQVSFYRPFILISYLFFIVSSSLFQSTTQQCSRWEMVSSKHFFYFQPEGDNSCSCVEPSCLTVASSISSSQSQWRE